MNQSLVNDTANPTHSNITWLPDLLYVNGRFERDMALACDFAGRILAVTRLSNVEVRENEVTTVALPREGLVFSTRFVRLRNRALLPGMVNAHSHAFQRVIRGRTECRSNVSGDSFWTWREMMYSAAARLSPEDVYDASRMAFLEMAAGGITAVGEFHYIHRTPEGAAYDDPNLLARQVVSAARDVGVRIALLRVAYARSGFEQPPNERQARFIEPDVSAYLRHVEDLNNVLAADDEARALPRPDGATASRTAWVGVAPHSVRAVPLPYLRETCAFAAQHALPVHMHVAEQPAEISACLDEHGRTPVALLADEGLLGPRFTGVHAIHITPDEINALAGAGANVCACPTTERNLGDGIIPADALFAANVPVALGTDSHTQIDLLEDARELEYHLRLVKLQRAVLAPDGDDDNDDAPHQTHTAATKKAHPSSSIAHPSSSNDAAASSNNVAGLNLSALALRLFDCATSSGARSIGAPSGALEPGRPADFFTVDLNDPSIAGAEAESLLPAIVFSLARTAVREVAVGGRLLVEDGRHHAEAEIVQRFAALQRKLWGGASPH